MENKVTFTAFLKDEYSKKFDQLADRTDADIKAIAKDLDKLATTGKRANRSIDELDKRIATLSRAKKLTVDTSAIRFANQEIKALQAEKAKLEGSSESGGGMGLPGKGFAIAGIALAAGAAIKNVGDKSIDATAKYQRFQAVLSTSLGSDGAATSKMNEITKFAVDTPFQVDELTDSFIKLKSQGFQPTMAEMTSLGDIAASKAKSFNQLSEAVIDAQTFEFERLKEFGIKASQQGNSIKFLYNGKTTVVNKTSEAVREYILSIGRAAGVTGSMAAISKTTGGMISNLDDNFDLLYKTLGDRFTPEINAGISGLSSMVATVRTWFEIPLSEKLQQETDKLSALRVELSTTNTTEQRRKEILEEVKKIQPDIVDGTKSEKEQLDGLNSSLDSYISKRRQQIAFQTANEGKLKDLVKLSEARDSYNSTTGGIYGILGQINDPQYSAMMGDNSLTLDQKTQFALQYLKSKAKRLNTQGSGLGVGSAEVRNTEAEKLDQLNQILKQRSKAAGEIDSLRPVEAEAKANEDRINAILGIKPADPNAPATDQPTGSTTPGINSPTGKGGGDSVSSISGGKSTNTNIYINIDSLNKGGINIQTNHFSESVPKAVDMLKEGLLTVVNDANLVGAK